MTELPGTEGGFAEGSSLLCCCAKYKGKNVTFETWEHFYLPYSVTSSKKNVNNGA